MMIRPQAIGQFGQSIALESNPIRVSAIPLVCHTSAIDGIDVEVRHTRMRARDGAAEEREQGEADELEHGWGTRGSRENERLKKRKAR